MFWGLSSHPYKNVPEPMSFVLVVRNIDVGAIGVTIEAGAMVAFGVAIDTGKNEDGERNDAFAFDEFDDNVLLYGYIWRFSVWVALVGIRMWCVCAPDGTRDGGGGDGDDWNGNLVPLLTKVQH